ncbi:5614_t:CDS:10 [Ambispora gerdemannii]|uniref:5614_t:CDS:1 n=1 Tax=Ambispora gerdemannii TaxID=144530 RepID=A0A9N8ZHX2_9GLOM|nr:5614_t:CDS:10 [Ambispora gerdemannii]
MVQKRRNRRTATYPTTTDDSEDAGEATDTSTTTTATQATVTSQYPPTPTTSHPPTLPKLKQPIRQGIRQGIGKQASFSSQSRRKNSATPEDVEQIVNETFFLKHEEPKTFLTRKRVVFTAGLFFGLAIAWAFTEPTTVNQFQNISNFIAGSLHDLDFTSILPANILVEELLGNVTMYLKPNILEDTEFMPGLKLAEKGLKAKFPVILIPGIVSTGLESWSTSNCSQKYFRRRMWGTTTMFRAVLLDKECWKEHMKLDPSTGLDPPGVKLRAAQGLDAADYLFPGYWVWGKMIQNFAAIGYDSNNMHLAAYDWRLSIYNLEVRDKYYSKLKSNIEMFKKLDGKKSVLIGHSLGSTVVLYFLKWAESPLGGNGGPNWVNDHIESFVNIGGPLLGLPKALSALLSGEMRDTVELGAFGIYVLERFFSKRERAELFRTWGGLASMLPKGGEAIWGNATHAPDDKKYGDPDKKESFGPMLTFRSFPRFIKNLTKSSPDKSSSPDGPQLVHHHTSTAVVTFLQQHADRLFKRMLSTNYSFGLTENKGDFRDNVDHTKWSNPLESQLPYAPDLKIYCLYGIGKDTERRYYYSHDGVGTDDDCEGCDKDDRHGSKRVKRDWNVFIDSSRNADDQGLKSGVHSGEGDGTVPLMSLGYMCVKGWQNKLYNPAGIKVITREFVHSTTPSLDLRGGSKTADHVDILGNYAVTEDVLRVASGYSDSIENNIHSNIEKYSERVEL